MRIALAIVFGAAALMLAVELLRPGRSWPRVTGWWARTALLNGIQLGVVYLSGVAWDGWMQRHRPWSAEGLGILGGAAVGYVVHTFVYYWWHRARHVSPFLWRWVHQVHHSPQRIELITSFYKHPVEVLVNGVLSSAVLYLGVGLTPTQASAVFVLNALAEFFYHWNVSTPHWVGYLFQRPESHCVHHQESLHAFNYGDLPIFDMLFGTFRNPQRWEGRCGFGPEREQQLPAMLVGADVNAPSIQGSLT